eukprot:CAMPEP_0174841630 /NCGR_PEP_ID=MMETSP1114-20130205/9440_1 /TAXON_ID=312471 /ORGANISM="Neobodo designis, Strain CCAP 1951/1" /LENGTH=464 /DNA_ID=CAMNT_0016075821 /DNA_START=36 /DNA_END=1426 /DNA_ORIENTATION=-
MASASPTPPPAGEPQSPAAPADFEPADVLKEGDSVMITGGDLHRMLTLKPGMKMKLGKVANVDIGSLIGQPCGIMYEVDDRRRRLVPYRGPTSQDLEEAEVDADIAGKDNRHLLDAQSAAQNLTQEEIERMKQTDGVRGIVDKLVQSSATFNTKTAFSQQKYIRRKKKKYVCTFVVERPTPDSMCEQWCPTRRNETYPAIELRWVRMRVDALAQLLCVANIHATSRAMVVERTNGFLNAAILHRMGPDGVLYHVLNPQKQASMTYARNMDLVDVKRRWKCLRRAALLDPEIAGQHPAEKQKRDPRPVEPTAETDASSPVPEGAASTVAVHAGPAPAPEPSQWYNGHEARALFAENPCDTLVVADDSPALTQEVAELLPYVALGATIAVYCPFLEPLCELFRELRDDCVCMMIRDTWYREYQVLPGRTHPFVNMTHNGGYIFSAIRVQRRPDPAAAAAAAPLPEA